VIFCEQAHNFNLESYQKGQMALKRGKKATDSYVSTRASRRLSQTLQPGQATPALRSSARQAEDATQVLTLEFDGLPSETDKLMLKKMYLKNMHVIESEPEINNISGKCSGKAKVKMRFQNGLRSDAFLKSLYKKGASFRVQERPRAADAKATSENFSRTSKNHQEITGVGLKKNQWLGHHEAEPPVSKQHW